MRRLPGALPVVPCVKTLDTGNALRAYRRRHAPCASFLSTAVHCAARLPPWCHALRKHALAERVAERVAEVIFHTQCTNVIHGGIHAASCTWPRECEKSDAVSMDAMTWCYQCFVCHFCALRQIAETLLLSRVPVVASRRGTVALHDVVAQHRQCPHSFERFRHPRFGHAAHPENAMHVGSRGKRKPPASTTTHVRSLFSCEPTPTRCTARGYKCVTSSQFKSSPACSFHSTHHCGLHFRISPPPHGLTPFNVAPQPCTCALRQTCL